MINTAIAVLILAWTLWPIVCVMIGMALANAAGAPLDEGSVHPTVIKGVDYGDTAYALFVMGWFGMFTLPTGIMALLAQAIIATTEWLISIWRKKRKAAALAPSQPPTSP